MVNVQCFSFDLCGLCMWWYTSSVLFVVYDPFNCLTTLNDRIVTPVLGSLFGCGLVFDCSTLVCIYLYTYASTFRPHSTNHSTHCQLRQIAVQRRGPNHVLCSLRPNTIIGVFPVTLDEVGVLNFVNTLYCQITRVGRQPKAIVIETVHRR
jgi:hypothetical protein